jgi:hypothetical protein
MKIAELIVHETSHQYYHYAHLATVFSNGMDTSSRRDEPAAERWATFGGRATRELEEVVATGGASLGRREVQEAAAR